MCLYYALFTAVASSSLGGAFFWGVVRGGAEEMASFLERGRWLPFNAFSFLCLRMPESYITPQLQQQHR